MALPALESLGQVATTPAQRMVAINIPLGFHPPYFFPRTTGRDYQASKYLALSDHLRDHYTVISGVSHPGVTGGHSAIKSFLTAAPRPGERGFKNTISFDQVVANQVGSTTRYASIIAGETSQSWTANGVSIPQEVSPAKLYARLFLSGSAADLEKQRHQLEDGHSIIDSVMEEVTTMEKQVSSADRDKLDQFMTAVRETEKRLTKSEKWLATPKPKVDTPQPAEVGLPQVDQWMKSHFEVFRLALMTDSTRVITLGGAGHGSVVPLPGVSMGYHGLTHHGKNPDMIRQLEIIEKATMQTWVDFIQSLKDTPDGEGTLLDHTQVLMSSNLGNASGHITTNLPTILAGGNYKHGQHLAFDQKNNYPLANLFVSMMQGMGLEEDTFYTATGTMTGLI